MEYRVTARKGWFKSLCEFTSNCLIEQVKEEPANQLLMLTDPYTALCAGVLFKDRTDGLYVSDNNRGVFALEKETLQDLSITWSVSHTKAIPGVVVIDINQEGDCRASRDAANWVLKNPQLPVTIVYIRVPECDMPYKALQVANAIVHQVLMSLKVAENLWASPMIFYSGNALTAFAIGNVLSSGIPWCVMRNGKKFHQF